MQTISVQLCAGALSVLFPEPVAAIISSFFPD